MDRLLKAHYQGLKELFVGGELHQPQKSWLIPVKEPLIYIDGDRIETKKDQLWLNFGSVSPLQTKEESITVSNLTQQPFMVWVKVYADYLSANWENQFEEILLERSGGTADLQVTFKGGKLNKKSYTQAISLLAETDSGENIETLLNVRIDTTANFPHAKFDFNGMQRAIPHGFGTIDPVKPDTGSPQSYRLGIVNTGQETLTVSLESLPPWLTVKKNKKTVKPHPAELNISPNKEVTVTFRPKAALEFLGKQKCRTTLITNDSRPDHREIPLQFSVKQEINEAFVTAITPPRIEVDQRGSSEFKIQLLNHGNSEATITPKDGSAAVTIDKQTVIPAASDGRAQEIDLRATASGKGLTPGVQQLTLKLTVSGGSQEELTIPIDITVIKSHKETFTVKICDSCHLAENEEYLYCSLCGTELPEAEEVSEDLLVKCRECKRMFQKGYQYCPVDGKPLAPISTEGGVQ